MRNYRFIDYATQGYMIFVALLILLFHGQTVAHWEWLLAGHALVVVLVHVLIRVQARMPEHKALNFLRHFYPILLYTAFYRETGTLNQMFFTGLLDHHFVRMDQAIFGFQPSLAFMERYPYEWLSETFYASYFSYYLMIAGIGVTLFVRGRAEFAHYVSVVSFVFYVCYLIYICLPVLGPRVFFYTPAETGINYVLPPDLQALAAKIRVPDPIESGLFFSIMKFIYHHFESPGAAFPSSHVAVAWCTVFFSVRYLPRIRIAHAIVAVLLCLATVYCRYHYVVDVIAGLFTAAVLIPLGNWLYLRFRVPEAAGAGGQAATASPSAPPDRGS